MATRELQSRAEGLVEDHKRQLLRSIEDLYDLSTRQAEIQGLERQLRSAQCRLDEIRKENPALQLGQGTPDPTADKNPYPDSAE